MERKEAVATATALAYRYLKFRSRTIWEMRTYLQKKALLYHFTEADIEAVVSQLIDIRLLDDGVFIGEFVRSRNAVKPKGVAVLRYELKRYGVQDADIDSYFANHGQDEETLADRVFRSKIKPLRAVSDEQKRFAKAVSFMQRRGFSFDIAKRLYQKYFQA